MKLLFLLSFICLCYFSARAQLSLSDTISDQSTFSSTAKDGKLGGNYPNGNIKYKGSKLKDDLHGSNGKLIRILFFKEGKYLWRKDIKEGVEQTEEETSGS